MRILNRAIAAGALVVPMALGVSGVAVADVAAGGSMLPTQIGASEGADSDDCETPEFGGDGFAEGLLDGDLLGGGDDSDDDKCGGDDRGSGNGLPG